MFRFDTFRLIAYQVHSCGVKEYGVRMYPEVLVHSCCGPLIYSCFFDTLYNLSYSKHLLPFSFYFFLCCVVCYVVVISSKKARSALKIEIKIETFTIQNHKEHTCSNVDPDLRSNFNSTVKDVALNTDCEVSHFHRRFMYHLDSQENPV